ncbi:hypothetical protein, partial [Streptomyces sp. NPDC059071]|uniref:DUF7373 family lipoprotein n=1 Tax=Streptomyces sp. NPDC059071 TaxID=3346714 RepID=UPI00369EF3D1
SLWSGIKGSTGGSAESPAHVPDVFCSTKTTEESGVFWSAYDVKSTGTVYVCTLHYDRYVAQVASPQLTDVQQRAAAQYALLANSRYM